MTNEEYEKQFRKKWDAGDFEYVSQGYGEGFDQDYIWDFITTALDEAREEGKESERWIRGDYTPEMVEKVKEKAIREFATDLIGSRRIGNHLVKQYLASKGGKQ